METVISIPCTQIRVGQARIYDGDGPYLARTKVDRTGERKPVLVIRGPDSRCESPSMEINYQHVYLADQPNSRYRIDVDGPDGKVLLFRTHRQQPVFLVFVSTSKTLITLFRPEYQPEAFDNEDGRKYIICEVDGELPDGALDLLLRDRKWSAIHQEISDGDVELYVSERKDELIRIVREKNLLLDLKRRFDPQTDELAARERRPDTREQQLIIREEKVRQEGLKQMMKRSTSLLRGEHRRPPTRKRQRQKQRRWWTHCSNSSYNSSALHRHSSLRGCRQCTTNSSSTNRSLCRCRQCTTNSSNTNHSHSC